MNNSMNFKLSKDTQNIKELWQSVADLAVGRVADNELCGGVYPLGVREYQLCSLKALVDTIEDSHRAMESIPVYKFFYSHQQNKIGGHNTAIVNGRRVKYTEMMEEGTSNFDDAVYLGSTRMDAAQIKY